MADNTVLANQEAQAVAGGAQPGDPLETTRNEVLQDLYQARAELEKYRDENVGTAKGKAAQDALDKLKPIIHEVENMSGQQLSNALSNPNSPLGQEMQDVGMGMGLPAEDLGALSRLSDAMAVMTQEGYMAVLDRNVTLAEQRQPGAEQQPEPAPS